MSMFELEMASSTSVDLYGAVQEGRLVIVDVHTRGEPGQFARYSVSPKPPTDKGDHVGFL